MRKGLGLGLLRPANVVGAAHTSAMPHPQDKFVKKAGIPHASYDNHAATAALRENTPLFTHAARNAAPPDNGMFSGLLDPVSVVYAITCAERITDIHMDYLVDLLKRWGGRVTTNAEVISICGPGTIESKNVMEDMKSLEMLEMLGKLATVVREAQLLAPSQITPQAQPGAHSSVTRSLPTLSEIAASFQVQAPDSLVSVNDMQTLMHDIALEGTDPTDRENARCALLRLQGVKSPVLPRWVLFDVLFDQQGTKPSTVAWHDTLEECVIHEDDISAHVGGGMQRDLMISLMSMAYHPDSVHMSPERGYIANVLRTKMPTIPETNLECTSRLISTLGGTPTLELSFRAKLH